METLVTRSPRVAAGVIHAGGLAAFPTETVYGIGADALRSGAAAAVFRAKGRPTDNPLIVHIGNLNLIGSVARRLPAAAEKIIAAFFPGPVTVIVPKHRAIPPEVTAGLDTVGIRFPSHPVASAFLNACGIPVAAPSANRSGRPSPTTWRAAYDELAGRVGCVLKGPASEVGLESTVVDCTSSRPVILREGAVTLEQLREVVPAVRAGMAAKAGAPVRSPGMKYRHYAPAAEVILVGGPEEVPAEDAGRCAYIGLRTNGFCARPAIVQPCRGVDPYAQKLFQFFRVCERRGIVKIYCERVSPSGLGRALMDRLQRAASGHPSASSGEGRVRG